MKENFQWIVDRLKNEETSIKETQELLHHPSSVVRVNAVDALARRSRDGLELIEDLVTAAKHPKNDTPLMGTITVAHVAVASLFRVGTQKALAAGKQLLDEWPEPDRSDLLWYLKSESPFADTGRCSGESPPALEGANLS